MAETNTHTTLDDHADAGDASLARITEFVKRGQAAQHEVEAVIERETLRLIIGDLVTLGRVMRAAQIEYFKSRLREDLIAAKHAERMFDECLKKFAPG